ncbi:hypothetical protein MATL_G00105510 [Megalops atlanticus]|uniref:Uncharacterized protein n=1 Tax=Megalops atlanticus TaxID=7932 RepID=A0A9D3Q3F6_MEGAT|nr:hypothetical protein MATL_G00105510 [Megalops atlanticus]
MRNSQRIQGRKRMDPEGPQPRTNPAPSHSTPPPRRPSSLEGGVSGSGEICSPSHPFRGGAINSLSLSPPPPTACHERK